MKNLKVNDEIYEVNNVLDPENPETNVIDRITIYKINKIYAFGFDKSGKLIKFYINYSEDKYISYISKYYEGFRYFNIVNDKNTKKLFTKYWNQSVTFTFNNQPFKYVIGDSCKQITTDGYNLNIKLDDQTDLRFSNISYKIERLNCFDWSLQFKIRGGLNNNTLNKNDN